MGFCTSPGSFSDYVQEGLLKRILNNEGSCGPWTYSGPLQAGLGSMSSGSFLEITEAGYRRIPIDFVDPPVTSGLLSYTRNAHKLVWGPAHEPWSTITVVAIFASGNLVTLCPIGTSINVRPFQQFTQQRHEITVGVRSGTPPYWSKYLQEAVVRFVYLLSGSLPNPTHAALSDTLPAIDDTGSTIIEPSDSVYKRAAVPAQWSCPSADAFGVHWSSQNPLAPFNDDPATQNWLSGFADVVIFVDSATGGNLLFFNQTSIQQAVFKGEIAKLGAVNVGLT